MLVDPNVQEELEAFRKVREALSLDSLTADKASAVRELVSLLSSGSEDDSEEQSLFNSDDLSFIEEVKATKMHPDMVDALVKTMTQVILKKQRGTPLVDDIYSQLFIHRLLGDNSSKVVIYKLIVRRKYRLIYSISSRSDRPNFLAFDHRKDIYKHVGLRSASS